MYGLQAGLRRSGGSAAGIGRRRYPTIAPDDGSLIVRPVLPIATIQPPMAFLVPTHDTRRAQAWTRARRIATTRVQQGPLGDHTTLVTILLLRTPVVIGYVWAIGIAHQPIAIQY